MQSKKPRGVGNFKIVNWPHFKSRHRATGLLEVGPGEGRGAALEEQAQPE